MIFRAVHDKHNPYFQMRRDTAQTSHISFEALGALTYLLSKPDGWRCTIEDLIARGNTGCDPDARRIGRDKVYKIVKELKDACYIKAERERRDDGTYGPIIHNVYELPYLPESDDCPLPEKPEMAQPLPDLPDTVLPDTAAPLLAGPRHVNTEYRNYRDSEKTERESKRPLALAPKPGNPVEMYLGCLPPDARGVSIFVQEQITQRVQNLTVWAETLRSWKLDGYRFNRIGKILDAYEERLERGQAKQKRQQQFDHNQGGRGRLVQ